MEQWHNRATTENYKGDEMVLYMRNVGMNVLQKI